MITSLDIVDRDLRITLQPVSWKDEPILTLISTEGTVNISASNEQLAQIAERIQRHLESVNHQEYPDVERLLAAECEAAIEGDADELRMDQRRVG